MLEKKYTLTHTEYELQNIGWRFFEALRMLDFIKQITSALEQLESKLSPTVYSMGVEYGNHIHYLTPVIYNMIKHADFTENPTPLRRIEAELRKPRTTRTKWIYR